MRLIVFVLTLYFATPVFGQEKLSLATAIKIGLENSFEVEIAEQNLQIATLNNNWGNTGVYPTIDFNINSNNGYANARNPGFLIEQSSLNFGITPSLDFSWTIYDGKKAKITKQQLATTQQQQLNGVAMELEDAIRTILLAYHQVLIQEEKLYNLKQLLAFSRDKIQHQKFKKAFGQSRKFDFLQIKNTYLNDSTQVLIQQNNLSLAYRNLNTALGQKDLQKRYDLTDKLEKERKIYQLAALETKLFANNLHLQNLLINKQLAILNIKMQESAKAPTIQFQGGVDYNLVRTGGRQTIAFGEQPPTETKNNGTGKSFNVGVNFQAKFNLFDAGRNRRKMETSKLESTIAQLQINQLKRTLSNQLQQVLSDYNNQVGLIQLSEELVANARENLLIGEQKFDGGQLSTFDLRTLQLTLANALESRLEAIYHLKNLEVDLWQLTGGLINR